MHHQVILYKKLEVTEMQIQQWMCREISTKVQERRLKWYGHVMWSAVAQLVECWTRNRESPGSNPRCYRFEVWAFSFTSRRLSRLS